MTTRDQRVLAATALLSAPVLRSAMDDYTGTGLAQAAVGQLMQTGIGTGVTTIRALIWRCDRWLARNYRNDHVYRKALLSQLLPPDTQVALAEFKANKSIVDFIAVTNSLHAFELKSDLDSTSRLPSQLADYRQIAPLVSVLGNRRLVKRVQSMQEFEGIGLSWLDSGGRVHLVRQAVFDTTHLDSVTMMRSLRRAEYLRILRNLGIPVPEMPNTHIFSYVREAVQALDPEVYHTEFAKQLQQRRPRVGLPAIAKLPKPLRPTLLRLNPTKENLARLHKWLEQEVLDVHA